ncbi:MULTISPECIES: ABC transporter ATP-binding protein [unclassified Enterococcus]|uniref:ABC transporter ATP-binding protein n=1 Tax=unclassified Enterococcus TaxID=2608891 RepID=UPI001CE0B756|nr:MULTISPECIES: ABC transporter ATP-binding protein [unclassified Enterococcus]MCA5012058.1 ABC transporter ATP-binding protein [Enterococcus sp. S23]MCA5015309.1 ABC transporter ATP-binding protein [Enterococcus sp. S22(2020)]
MKKIIKRLPKATTAIAVLFLLVQTFSDLYLPTLTAQLINQGVVPNDQTIIWQKGFLMLGFAIISFGGALINIYFAAKVSYGLGGELREALFKKVTSFSQKEMDRFGSSSLITRNTNDVTQVQNLVEMGLKFLILAPLYLVGGIYFAYRLSPSLTMAFVSVTPIILIVCWLIFRYTNPLFDKMQRKIDQLNLIFKEGLTGIKVIHAFNKEQEEYQRYQKENELYTKLAIRSNTAFSFLMPFITLMMSLATIAITWLGAGLIDTGQMEIGTMMGVVSYAAQILMGVAILTMVLSSIPRGQISAKRINGVLETENVIQDGSSVFAEHESKTNSLILDQVSFSYDGAEEDALERISLSVRSGETLAIIGSTGSGKTTLVNLLDRLYDPRKGSIRFNEQEISQISQSNWHEQVSLVPQVNQLFFGTIRENLLVGNQWATDDELWDALALAQATDFVQAQGGLDGAVEKNGGNFSGGQKQRLCLARAFVKNAAIYLFDDSFSALDFKTDATIQKKMKAHLNQAIKIIVAQRITTVKNATKILVLNEGQMVGWGTHEELAETNAVYQEIILSQEDKEAA